MRNEIDLGLTNSHIAQVLVEQEKLRNSGAALEEFLSKQGFVSDETEVIDHELLPYPVEIGKGRYQVYPHVPNVTPANKKRNKGKSKMQRKSRKQNRKG